MIYLSKNNYKYFSEINEGILKQVSENRGEKKKVLDIGCGDGTLSAEIRKKGYEVWGIENSGFAAGLAAKNTDKLIECDIILTDKIAGLLNNEKFDIIVFSDVLEHLYDPFNILNKYIAFLKDGGTVLVSLPNIAVWETRIKLLCGIFDYADTGVMDRTHIRFFTFKSAKQLVTAAGLKIKKTDYTPYMIRALLPLIKTVLGKAKASGDDARKGILNSPLYGFYMKFIYPVEYIICYLCKPFFAFRIIIAAEKAGKN